MADTATPSNGSSSSRRRRRKKTSNTTSTNDAFHRLYSQTTVASRNNKYDTHKQKLLEERSNKIKIEKEDVKEYYKKKRSNTGLYSKSSTLRFHEKKTHSVSYDTTTSSKEPDEKTNGVLYLNRTSQRFEDASKVNNDLSYDVYGKDLNNDNKDVLYLNRTSERFTTNKNVNDLSYDNDTTTATTTSGKEGSGINNRTSERFEKVVPANNHTYVVEAKEENDNHNLRYNNRTSERFHEDKQRNTTHPRRTANDDDNIMPPPSMSTDVSENSQRTITANFVDDDDYNIALSTIYTDFSSSFEEEKNSKSCISATTSTNPNSIQKSFQNAYNHDDDNNHIVPPSMSTDVSENSQRTNTATNDDLITLPLIYPVVDIDNYPCEQNHLEPCISSTTTSTGMPPSISADLSQKSDDANILPPSISITDIYSEADHLESNIHTPTRITSSERNRMKVPEEEELEYLFQCMDDNSTGIISLIVLDSVIRAFYPNYFHLNTGSYNPDAFHAVYMQHRQDPAAPAAAPNYQNDAQNIMDRKEFSFFMHYLVYYHNLSMHYAMMLSSSNYNKHEKKEQQQQQHHHHSSACITRDNFRKVLKDMDFLNFIEKDNNDVNELFDMIDINFQGFIHSDDFCNFLALYIVLSSEREDEDNDGGDEWQSIESANVTDTDSLTDNQHASKLEETTLATADDTEADRDVIVVDGTTNVATELQNYTISVNKRRSSSISEIMDGIPEDDFKNNSMNEENSANPLTIDREEVEARSKTNFDDASRRMINELNTAIMRADTATRCYYFCYPS